MAVFDSEAGVYATDIVQSAAKRTCSPSQSSLISVSAGVAHNPMRILRVNRPILHLPCWQWRILGRNFHGFSEISFTDFRKQL